MQTTDRVTLFSPDGTDSLEEVALPETIIIGPGRTHRGADKEDLFLKGAGASTSTTRVFFVPCLDTCLEV